MDQEHNIPESVPIQYIWNKNGALFFIVLQPENNDNYYNNFEIGFKINRSNEFIIVKVNNDKKQLIIKNKPTVKLEKITEKYRTRNCLIFIKSSPHCVPLINNVILPSKFSA